MADGLARQYQKLPGPYPAGYAGAGGQSPETPFGQERDDQYGQTVYGGAGPSPVPGSCPLANLFLGEAVRREFFTAEALGGWTARRTAHILDLFARANAHSPLNRSLYVDLKSYLSDNILLKVDRMSMAVSLEARVPYLDTDMVELAFQVPERFKVKKRGTKLLLKKVAARRVPRECVYRPKEGFSIPMKTWLNGPLRPLMEELAGRRRLKKDGLFRPETVERLKQEHQANRANHSHILWALMVFQSWKIKWLNGDAQA